MFSLFQFSDILSSSPLYILQLNILYGLSRILYMKDVLIVFCTALNIISNVECRRASFHFFLGELVEGQRNSIVQILSQLFEGGSAEPIGEVVAI